MAAYSYALGTSNPPTNLETLLASSGYPRGTVPRGRFYEAATFLDQADGQVSGQGSPYFIWPFDVLTQAMVNTLRTICPGYSATVYATTRKTDGTFVTYQAVMVWPAQDQMDKRQMGGKYVGLEFTFRRAQVV